MIIRLFTNTLVAHRAFVIPYLIFLCAGTIALSFVEKEQLFLEMHHVHTAALDFIFRYLTHLGDGLFWVVVVLTLAFYRFGYASFLALCFALSGLLAQFLKKLVFPGALRPMGWFGSDEKIALMEGVDLHAFHSFPSGHTATAFSLLFAVALISPRKWLGVPLLLLAVFIGYSRVYIGQHFFEDVYFGSVVGVLCTLIVWLLFYSQWDKPWTQKSLLRLKK